MMNPIPFQAEQVFPSVMDGIICDTQKSIYFQISFTRVRVGCLYYDYDYD